MVKEEALIGFDPVETEDNEDESLPKLQKKGKGGGFQAMGLSFPVLKGVTKRGYKIPTPIQRKTIPLALEGRDIVAMARTGSGKTACFLIPLLERLKSRTAKSGARGLILSPTRELALQTLKFVKELGRFTDLRAAVILGGDSMDHQFGAIHGSPDIIVATPGRFLHICVEMELKLNGIEYIVFDEADRLFEMGFGEQLREIVSRLPETRQTLLFSATLPKVLVEFAKAGLSDPTLIRLDVETKLPSELTLSYITCRPEEKLAVLLVLLKTIIPKKQQTVVFAATRHHVEYIHSILNTAGISNTYIYSNLDPTARKINAAKFSSNKARVLVVTDVAARGIDIPQLDNVINYNFPAKSKLFVHRVGRCARAGRTGTAYSIIGPDEYAHLLDLHLFLGREFQIIPPAGVKTPKRMDLSVTTEAVGGIPQDLIEEQHGALQIMHKNSTDLTNMVPVCNNGYEKYLKSRPPASVDSNRRIKDLNLGACGIHPIFKAHSNEAEEKRRSLLYQMKEYRPLGTIFEICSKNKSKDYQAMKGKRAYHKTNIEKHHQRKDTIKEQQEEQLAIKESVIQKTRMLPQSNAEEISDAFKTVVVPKRRKIENMYKNEAKRRKFTKDEENYIPYNAVDRHTEDGLAVNTFTTDAEKLAFDITADSEEQQRLNQQMKRWDRKKMKMVGVQSDKKGKIRTESGLWIPATYKGNRYEQWKERTKIDAEQDNDESDNEDKSQKPPKQTIYTHWAQHNTKVKEKQKRVELKAPEQILKQREIVERRKKKMLMKKKKGGKKGGGRSSGGRSGGGGGKRRK